MSLITRKRYMELHTELINDDEARATMHQAYYAQFLNDKIISLVAGAFSPEELVSSYGLDRHLNTIDLERWDDVSRKAYAWADHEAMHKLGQFWSMSTGTCITKAAAKVLISRYLARPAGA